MQFLFTSKSTITSNFSSFIFLIIRKNVDLPWKGKGAKESWEAYVVEKRQENFITFITFKTHTKLRK